MNAHLKLIGYLLSELSVMLLAVSAWYGTGGKPALQLAVALGTILALMGMTMRGFAYWRKQQRKRQKLP